MSGKRSIVEEFIREQVSDQLINVAETLASLSYPISDRKSLESQLEKQAAGDKTEKKSNAKVHQMILQTFLPEDFGIDSVRNGLDKFAARVENSKRATFPFPTPLIPTFPSLPTEPVLGPPTDTDFGPGVCGRAAAELWRQHLQSGLTQALGPSRAHYRYLKDRAERCRQIRHPNFRGDCRGMAQFAYARCFILEGSPRECMDEARQAIERCERFGLGSPFGDVVSDEETAPNII